MSKTWRWALAVALLVAVIILVFRSCHGPAAIGRALSECERPPASASGHACIAVGAVTRSVWDDGTVAVAIAIENQSNSVAAQVRVKQLQLGSSTPVVPDTFPVELGALDPDRSAIVNAHFRGLAEPGAYELAVNGTYVDAGTERPFSARVRIPVARSRDGDAIPATTTLTKRKTDGRPLAPSKIDMEHDNPAGPPIPDGPTISPFAPPPSSTGIRPASGASDVSIIVDTSGAQNTLLVPPDPTTAEGGGLVLSTGNTFLRLSTDDGATFTNIDPTTIFKNADGGLCCDQVVLYDPAIDRYFWLLQYKSVLNPADPGMPGPNRLRLAWASPAAIKANSSDWAFVDLQAQVLLKTVDSGLDYPDLAFTDQNLYVSVDAVVTRDPATGKTGVKGLVVARIPLAHITAGGNTVGVSWIGPDQADDQNIATAARLTQSSADAMYWGGHVDGSKVKVFRWKDADSGMHTHDVGVDTWCKDPTADFKSTGPDGVQWLDSIRANLSAISGNARRPFSDVGQNHGEVWLGWTAGKQDRKSSCSKNRPTPFVKILRINDQSLEGIGEYHIWNSAYSFAYPSLATTVSGEIGISVPYGGSGDFPTSTIGFLGDFVLYSLEASDVTLGLAGGGTRIGDFYTVRRSGPNFIDLSSETYAVKLVDSTRSTSCTTAPACRFSIHYVQWGRPPVTIQ